MACCRGSVSGVHVCACLQCLANESAGGKAIVILAEREKADMEDDIHKHIRNLRGTRVLCRCARMGCMPKCLRASSCSGCF